MNKSNSGKQHKQKDTIIPDNAPAIHMHGQVQKMTMANGEAKGLSNVLVECGFDVSKIWRAKCMPICPFENIDCCMAHILSHQHDFTNQVSIIKEIITNAGHLCIFLPKYHCELNPIEMVCLYFYIYTFH